MARRGPLLLLLLLGLCAALASPINKHASGEEAAASTRIVGGERAGSSLPWVVFFEMTGGSGDNVGTCTGSFLSDTWVLSAAHCVLNDDEENPALMPSVPPGAAVYHSCQGGEVGSGPDKFDRCEKALVKRWVTHPCFDATDIANHDILLVELMAPQRAVSAFPSIDTSGAVDTSGGRTVTLAGFGLTSGDIENPMPAEYLNKVDVPIATEAFCRQQENGGAGIADFSTQLCTGGAAGKDSCNGDSGGPVFTNQDGTTYILGVSSRGSALPDDTPNCAVEGRLGVYTRVSSYAGWIDSIISSGSFSCSSGCGVPACGVGIVVGGGGGVNAAPKHFAGLTLPAVLAVALCLLVPLSV